jgi:hypothetical protein
MTMTPYEVENIAQQKVNGMRDEGAIERITQGQKSDRSNTLPRTVAAALAILTLFGWIAQGLLFGAS